MEPADLKPPSPSARDDARLEALLREPVAPVPDAGFTQRVFSALPPSAAAPAVISSRQVARPNWGRLAACAIGAVIGGAIGYVGEASWVPSVAHLESFVLWLGEPTTLVALFITTAALLYALRPRALARLWP